MKIVIVSGGSAPSEKLIRKELEESSFLICADSGGNSLYQYKLIPDYLMGDFDSISREAFDFFSKEEKCSIEEYPTDKDFTDTELVLNKARELGGKEIVFLGCTGTRVDHLMGNIGMLARCNDMGIKAYIKDENNTIELIDKSTIITGYKGETFSLQAYNDVVEDLNIIGAKYELHHYNLALGDPRTISNEFLKDTVEIKFNSGRLLVLRSRD